MRRHARLLLVMGLAWVVVMRLAMAGESTMPGERTRWRAPNTVGFYWNPITRRLGHNTTTPAVGVDWREDSVSNIWRLTDFSDSASSTFDQRRARGTAANPTAVQSGDVIAQYSACGHDGTAFCGFLGLPDVNMRMAADGSWTTSSHPTRIEYITTPSGSTVSAVRHTIDNAGNEQFVGLASKYNNITTVSNGVPAEYAKIDTTGLTGNVGSALLYAVPAAGAGMYRISSLVVETTAASVSSTLPNVQIVYTDNDVGSGTVTIDATPVLGVAGIGQTGALTANTVGTTATGVIVINVKASTNINYLTTNYASSTAGMAYALHIKAEAL